MTDRKLLEDVRDALKPFAERAGVEYVLGRDETPAPETHVIGNELMLQILDLRRARDALSRVEAALAETEEESALSGKYVIWSNEHRAWWRANSCGYSVNIMGAGLYEKDEAEKICRCAAERHEEMHPAAEALTRATKDWATNATIWGAIAAMGE